MKIALLIVSDLNRNFKIREIQLNSNKFIQFPQIVCYINNIFEEFLLQHFNTLAFNSYTISLGTQCAVGIR